MARVRIVRLILLAGVVLSSASSVWAEIIPVLDGSQNPIEFTLEEVMAMPDGLRVGDKVFSDWVFTDDSQNGGLAPTPEGITVKGVFFDLNGNGVFDSLGDEIGLCFSGGWSAFADQIADTIIEFKVTADEPFLIVDNTLKMTAAGSAGTGQASIVEALFSDANLDNLVVRKVVFDNAQGIQHVDHAEFPPGYTELWVVKDVIVNGGGDGMAHISQFYNVFSQVPEPSSLLLLCAGAVLLFARRRK